MDLLSNDVKPLGHYETDLELHDIKLHKSVSSQTSDDSESESLTKGRCTPHETTVSQCGSVSVRFEEMIIEVLNATTIHVDWCPVINKNNLHGYKIRYATKDNSSYNEIFVTSGISSYTITGLRPSTEYDIWVTAIGEKESVIHQCGCAMQRTDNLTGETFEVPYIAAIAAIALLLIAVIVPITFLFMRNCGECETSPSDNDGNLEIVQEQAADKEDMETKIMTSSFRHRNDVIRKFLSSGLSFKGRRN